MSETTGLSQSQVYKWWWDQKKKNMNNEKENYNKLMNKRKFIRKDLSNRPMKLMNESNGIYSYYEIQQNIQTKQKNAI